MRSFLLKISFFLVLLSIILFLVAGVGFARDNPYLTLRYLKSRLALLWYKVEFALAVNDVFTSGEAKDVPVLIYHGIVQASDGSNTPNENFEEQMLALKRAGYQTIALEDLYAFLRGEKKLPAKSFLLTFDDGRKDSYYPVDPVLAALDYNAVMFATSKFSLSDKSEYYLTAEELKQMQGTGRWEIASHGENSHEFYPVNAEGSRGNFFSNKLWLAEKNRLETDEEFTARINSDLLGSKDNFEKSLGIKVLGFAFPFGNFGFPTENFPGAQDIVIQKAKEVYPMSFYQFATEYRFNSNYSRNQATADRTFFVKRIEVKPEWTPENLLKVVENANSKSLPYSDNFREDKGWIRTWGEIGFTDQGLEMKPAPEETGSAMILDGSGAWDNYNFSASIGKLEGSNVYLWARLMDDDNFVACNFGPDRVHIDQVSEGALHVVRGTERPGNLPKENFNVSIRVDEREVGCYLNGELIVKTEFLDPSLERGGVGIKIWDTQKNVSWVLIKEVRVDSVTTSQVPGTPQNIKNQGVKKKQTPFADVGEEPETPSTTENIYLPPIKEEDGKLESGTQVEKKRDPEKKREFLKSPVIENLINSRY